MMELARPVILAVDDDAAVLASLRRGLGRAGYDVRTAEDPDTAWELLGTVRPALILLDVVLPGGVDGFELCRQICRLPEFETVPVVFVTALDSPQDEAKAFAAGGAAFIRKPFDLDVLLKEIERHVGTGRRWAALREDGASWLTWIRPDTFDAFKRYLVGERRAGGAPAEDVDRLRPGDLYGLAALLNLSEEHVARYAARFLDIPYLTRILPEDVPLGVLPRAFCERNLVAPVRTGPEGFTVAITNPFDFHLLEMLSRTVWRDCPPRVAMTAPDVMRLLFVDPRDAALQLVSLEADPPPPGVVSDPSVHELASMLVRSALQERASDLHIEPKDRHTLVRFRIDGDMHDVRTLDHAMASKLVSRFKALAGMDIAERRRPQDGSVEVLVHGRKLKLRLATSSTTDGETLVIRVLEPDRSALPLGELGMEPEQVDSVVGMANRHQGMILVVGPTGSGKSTTIFSLLSQVDGRTRSIMSVEDPVEYRIPFANQQQVNDRAGVTFESLLRSAMRQDPDILFLGEIRDSFSAKASLDFASSGHLTVSTLHCANATAAVFRLERLGVERAALADALLGVVAQKLVKRLCPHCKEVGPVTPEERGFLLEFTDAPPEIVARPRGCPACRDTGYLGREAVVEVLPCDAMISELIRGGASVAEIRTFCVERGDFMMFHHAVRKVERLVCPPRDAYEHVLLEEGRFRNASEARTLLEGRLPRGEGRGESGPVRSAQGGYPPQSTAEPGKGEAETGAEHLRVLVVEDDPVARRLAVAALESDGFQVACVEDGVHALLEIGQASFDVIVSDLNMPHLDGLRLLDVLVSRGIDVPVVFLTSDTASETEARVLQAGAADFVRKPVEPTVLRRRVRTAAARTGVHAP